MPKPLRPATRGDQPGPKAPDWPALVESIRHVRPFSRIVPVIADAVAVFGDENKAAQWLSTPLALFANRSPSQVLEDEGGIEAVDRILTRIEHNIPS
jgi:putative toxin-antitoxin system antitoxin component (TIGR02293 family)